MSDDETKRTARAGRPKTSTPIAEQATRKVKAVRRKSPAVKPNASGLLPEGALQATCFRFVETNLGWGMKSSLTTDRYEVQLIDRTPVLRTRGGLSLFPGWHFEVRDLNDVLRFKLSLGTQKLVMNKVTVFTPDGEELGRIEQRFSLMEVKFDILNPDGSLRFKLYQPPDVFTAYEIRDGDARVARISKDKLPPVQGFKDLMAVEDAFRVELESSSLDERDRVLILAATLFMDRVFHTGKDE